MDQIYKHKETLFLVGLMLVFTFVFFLSYFDLRAEQPIIKIGIAADIVNGLVMALSVLSILRVIFLLRDLKVKASEE